MSNQRHKENPDSAINEALRCLDDELDTTRVGRFRVGYPAFGDVMELTKELPSESIDCIVTSPPYWALRDYGTEGQLGLEKTPQEYITRLVGIFRELRRVLKSSGTCWIVIGDKYAFSSMTGGNFGLNKRSKKAMDRQFKMKFEYPGLKKKDLIGLPAMLYFGLRDDGWYFRKDIIWEKTRVFPESVTDRPTTSHETIIFVTKSHDYFYDKEAIMESAGDWGDRQESGRKNWMMRKSGVGKPHSGGLRGDFKATGRNKRSVWTVAPEPFLGEHLAVYPRTLIRPCILAGCPEGGVVLDPFLGSGTTGQVAQEENRRWIGFEINEDYADMIDQRIRQRNLFGDNNNSIDLDDDLLDDACDGEEVNHADDEC